MIPLPYCWLMVGVYLAMLLGLSSIPGGGAGGSHSVMDWWGSDKVLHFWIYFPLGWLLALTEMRWWQVLLVGALLAGMDEIYQGTVPNRSPDFLDWMADMGGIAVGWFAEYRIKGKSRMVHEP